MGTHIRLKRRVACGISFGLVLLVGCGDSAYSPSGANGVARGRVTRGPVAPRRFATVPQTAVDTAAATVAPWAAIAFPADVSLDARLLVITADGTDPAFTAIVEGLQYLGTPFDVLDASKDPELTADRLATGNRGHYYGIFLDRGNLSTGTVSAFSTAEWGVLTDYEARFQVRRVALYAYPEAIYGLAPAGSPIDTTMGPLSIHCTDSGAAVFADTNCTNGIAVVGAYAYPAVATGPATVPVLVDAGGNILGATFTDASSREYLALTFAQSPSLVHSLSLIHDLVRWVTRGIFLGERHVYFTAQIDDLFLASDLYPYCSDCGDGGADGAPPAGSAPASIDDDGGTLAGLTYRITDLDMQALADWQAATRATPLTADIRFDWALNGVGSSASDPLTIRARALGSTFKWISHTWDHAVLDTINYTDAVAEFTLNNTLVSTLGLQPYDIRSLVTPSISGLDNPDAIRAAFDAGIRFMVGDTSVAGWNNPTPNAGIYSALQAPVLIIPRRPTNLFYNVSTPDKWQAEYNDIYRSYWGRDLTYSEILDFESNVLLQDLLRGANDPWMFHQANTRNYGSGQSLLTDLHGSLLAKYAAASKVPIVSDTMDVLGNRVAARMTYDRSQAAAVIGPGAQITVSVVNAASIPVTGLCTTAAESYGSDTIAYLDLPAGGAATFPLGNCNAGAGGTDGGIDGGAGGAVGNTGAGGALDSGGAVDVGGQSGTGGAVATGMGGDVGMGGTGGAVNGAMGGNLGAGGMLAAGGSPGIGGAVNVGTGGDPGSGGVLGTGGDLGSGGAGVGGETVGVGGASGSGAGGDLDSGAIALGGASGVAGFTGNGGGGAGAGGEGGQSTGAGIGGVGGDGAIGGMNGALADAGPTPANPSPSGGCSCSLAESSPGASVFGLVVAAAGLITRGRRRATSTAARKAS